jgi:predicted dehydrogenase
LRVAVIGLGVGEQHAAGFVRAGCSLRWLYDLDRAKAEAVRGRIGAGEIARDYAQILADPEVDAIALATYDDAHSEEVIAALKAGKHVFCEKPLCRTATELDAIEAAWRAAGRHLRSNLILRTAPLYRRIRHHVAAGDLGEIYAFYGDYLYGRLTKITEGWRGDVDDYSVMQGGGVHLVDLMCWLTGQRAVSVRATGNRLATRATKFRYDDFVVSTFELESGMTGIISANFACVHKHQHVVRIFGTTGTFIYDDMGARIYRERDPGGPPTMVLDAPLPAAKGDLIPDFIAGIERPDRAAETTLDFHVIRACLAADVARAKNEQTPVAAR